jgi:hypothetical protein
MKLPKFLSRTFLNANITEQRAKIFKKANNLKGEIYQESA